MRAFTRLRFWRGLRYRLGVTGVLLAYLLTALDIPLPASVLKDASQPFPCQDHPCGCRTAEQCWRSCCCFTPEQRWAWAREHNVDPPAYAEKPVEKPVAQGWNTVKLRDRDKQKTTPAAKNCCQTHKPEAPAREETPLANASGLWTTTIAVWKCRGWTTLWVSAGTVLPVPPLAAWVPDWTPPARVSLPTPRADKIPAIPPDPPPRLSSV